MEQKDGLETSQRTRVLPRRLHHRRGLEGDASDTTRAEVPQLAQRKMSRWCIVRNDVSKATIRSVK